MIRRIQPALVGLLVFVFPLGLVSQTSDSRRVASNAQAVPGGCFVSSSDVGGSGFGQTPDAAEHGFNVSNLDRAVMPCDDFFQYADGGWIKSNPIPPDRSRWSTFDQLHDRNEDVLHKILDDASQDKNAKPGSNLQKIGDYYAACMNEDAIEQAGLKPLDSDFARIAAIKDTAQLQAAVAHLQHQGIRALFEFGSEQDLKDSTQVIAAAGQGGLGLPDRDYYLQDEDRSKKIRDGYLQHVTNMFQLLGDDAATASSEANTVLKIETDLAKASMDRAEMRDPEKVYHKMELSQLPALTPHLSWNDYFREVGAKSVNSVDINEPDFFKQVDDVVQSVPLADWKIYLRWHLVHSTAPTLSKKFVEENFNFYGRTLRGTQQILPRWRRCVEATDGQLGEALGQIYVQRNFPPEAKTQALGMIQNLIAALRDDLSTLDWMSPATRQEAIKKLNAMNLKIGYPDKWRDYSAFKVDRVSYTGDYLRGASFEVARDLAKIGKPVDRAEWDMTPPTVNAYYAPSMNEIVFPAGILQPPFFDAKGDPAINYGGIGAVIGHEMTHGFDDQGAKYDPQGNLKDWWTPEDLKNFQARGDCIAKQFAAYEAEPGVHENGKLVEGESIADLGGLTISHAAFEKFLQGNPETSVVDGFTTDQRFFLGFAQIWAGSVRPEYARLMIKTDPHPMEQYRTDGTLSNMPSFAKAFGCAAGSPMVRGEELRCRIW